MDRKGRERVLDTHRHYRGREGPGLCSQVRAPGLGVGSLECVVTALMDRFKGMQHVLGHPSRGWMNTVCSQGTGRLAWGLWFGVWDVGCGERGVGFGVWGLGFGVWGLGFGVLGLGFGV